jgi:hypothetical protein
MDKRPPRAEQVRDRLGACRVFIKPRLALARPLLGVGAGNDLGNLLGDGGLAGAVHLPS